MLNAVDWDSLQKELEPEDGMPGYRYFQLNYSPIFLKKLEDYFAMQPETLELLPAADEKSQCLKINHIAIGDRINRQVNSDQHVLAHHHAISLILNIVDIDEPFFKRRIQAGQRLYDRWLARLEEYRTNKDSQMAHEESVSMSSYFRSRQRN